MYSTAAKYLHIVCCANEVPRHPGKQLRCLELYVKKAIKTRHITKNRSKIQRPKTSDPRREVKKTRRRLRKHVRSVVCECREWMKNRTANVKINKYRCCCATPAAAPAAAVATIDVVIIISGSSSVALLVSCCFCCCASNGDCNGVYFSVRFRGFQKASRAEVSNLHMSSRSDSFSTISTLIYIRCVNSTRFLPGYEK